MFNTTPSAETMRSSSNWVQPDDHRHDHHDHDFCHLIQDHNLQQKKLGLDGKRPRRIAEKIEIGEEEDMIKSDEQMSIRRRPISSSEADQNQMIQRACLGCKTTKTPLWRTGPAGVKSLCNACGIRYRKKRRKEEVEMKRNGGTEKNGKRFEETEETKAALLLMALSWGLLC